MKVHDPSRARCRQPGTGQTWEVSAQFTRSHCRRLSSKSEEAIWSISSVWSSVPQYLDGYGRLPATRGVLLATQVGARSADSRTEPPLPTWARVVLVALLVVMWLAWVFLGFFVLNITGVAGDFGGWRWAAVAFVPLLIPTWLLTRRLCRPRVSLAVSAVLVGLLVWGVTAEATPSFAPRHRVRAVPGAGGVAVPRRRMGREWMVFLRRLPDCGALLRSVRRGGRGQGGDIDARAGRLEARTAAPGLGPLQRRLQREDRGCRQPAH